MIVVGMSLTYPRFHGGVEKNLDPVLILELEDPNAKIFFPLTTGVN